MTSMPRDDGPIEGATSSQVGGVAVDEVVAGSARLKRLVYPPGWRWSVDMRPVSGTERCMHAHVGYLVAGSIAIAYADGCTDRFDAPAFVVVEPGHDGWVVGDDRAVLVQVDHGIETVGRFGLVGEHRH
jgi:hypothetical protein